MVWICQQMRIPLVPIRYRPRGWSRCFPLNFDSNQWSNDLSDAWIHPPDGGSIPIARSNKLTQRWTARSVGIIEHGREFVKLIWKIFVRWNFVPGSYHCREEEDDKSKSKSSLMIVLNAQLGTEYWKWGWWKPNARKKRFSIDRIIALDLSL